MRKNKTDSSDLRTWIEINQESLRKNYSTFRRLIGPKRLLMAVVKSNAYGHGLVDFSQVAERLGVDWFGVDSVVEAESLRKTGIKKPILVMGWSRQAKVKSALKENISLTISDFFSLKSFKGEKKRRLKIHIKIDTGMHRQGFLVSELSSVFRILQSRPDLKLEGIYTHFSSANNPDSPETSRQIKEFEKAVILFNEAGFEGFISHAAATAGMIAFSSSRLDMVRIGIGLYGLWPSEKLRNSFGKGINIRPVLTWKTVVGQIKNLPAESRIGYDLTEVVKKPSRVAILPVGYWHGFPRSLSGKGEVLVRGRRAKVLGRVSMDMISVDVTGIKGVRVGDEVVLIGRDGKSQISAGEFASRVGTTSYEIITRINPLIKKFLV